MYYSLINTAKKLNVSKSDVLSYRSLDIIKYSPKTDKYDLDSVLEKHTMTIPLYKYLNKEEETKIIDCVKYPTINGGTCLSRLSLSNHF